MIITPLLLSSSWRCSAAPHQKQSRWAPLPESAFAHPYPRLEWPWLTPNRIPMVRFLNDNLKIKSTLKTPRSQFYIRDYLPHLICSEFMMSASRAPRANERLVYIFAGAVVAQTTTPQVDLRTHGCADTAPLPPSSPPPPPSFLSSATAHLRTLTPSRQVHASHP